jgi:hypothetical protein
MSVSRAESHAIIEETDAMDGRTFQVTPYQAEVIRLAYAEHIVRCNEQDPRRVEDLLSLDGDLEKARKWMAFAYAKREGNPDRIRGLVAYLLSNYGAGEKDPEKRRWLIDRIEEGKIDLGDLTYEILKGTRLEWRHIFTLVGKEFNPTRERERVKRWYRRLVEASEGR